MEKKKESKPGETISTSRYGVCTVCGKQFNRIFNLKRHEEKCVPKTKLDKDKSVTCTVCGKQFNRIFNLKRHEEKCVPKTKLDKDKSVTCNLCEKKFSTKYNKTRHEKICAKKQQSTFGCILCDNVFHSPSELVRHQNETGHVQAGGSGSEREPRSKRKKANQSVEENEQKRQRVQESIRCRQCRFVTNSRVEMYDHRMRNHMQTTENAKHFQSTPWSSDESAPWYDNGAIDQDLKRTYEQHRHLILKRRKEDFTNITRYNFPTTQEFTMDQISRHIEEIFEENGNAYKINLAFGIILRHTETGNYRYFVPYYNDSILDRPMLISNRSDLEQLRLRLSKLWRIFGV